MRLVIVLSWSSKETVFEYGADGADEKELKSISISQVLKDSKS